MTPIVMLPGWGMKASVFDTIGDVLRERFEVRAMETPHDAATIAAEAPPRCLVVGWSLGAQLAIRWALAYPAQVARLVLIAATPSFLQREGWTCAMPLAVFDGFAAMLEHDPRAALERFTLLQAQNDASTKRVARTLRAALGNANADALGRSLRLLRDTDLRGSAPGIRQPALVVHGEHDGLVPLAAAESLARALPEARLEVIAGAAHAPFVSDPARVAGLLEEFFHG